MKRAFDKTRIKLASFDIDGTLYDKGIFLKDTKDALMSLAKAGIEIVVATGRNMTNIPAEIWDIPCIRYGILCNGALVGDIRTREVFFVRALDLKQSREIAQILWHFSNNLHFVCQDYGIIIRNDLFMDHKRYDDSQEKVRRNELEKYNRVVDSLEELNQAISDPIIKCGCRFENRQELLSSINELKVMVDAEIAETDENMLEITCRGVNKGQGLVMLCGRLGIATEDAIAFGDSGNDIPILNRVGFAVAMGNAYDDVKANADYVTDSIKESGVAKAIKYLFDI